MSTENIFNDGESYMDTDIVNNGIGSSAGTDEFLFNRDSDCEETTKEPIISNTYSKFYLSNSFNGKFFEKESLKSSSSSSTSSDHIIARCLLCKDSNKKIRGSSGVSSNFIKHLKRLHPNEHRQYFEIKKNETMRPRKFHNKQSKFRENLINFTTYCG